MAVVVAATLLVVVLVTWASSIGPNDVFRGDGIAPVGPPSESQSVAEGSAGGEPTFEEEEPPDVEVQPWVRYLMFLVDIALVVLLVVLLVRYVILPLVRRVRERRERRRGDGPDPHDFSVLEPPQRVARALLDDADDQRRLLVEGGNPRNAVVECWHRFETAAARTGLERRPWETSSEYTMRVLDLVDAYEPAVTRLADLYREARFSEHELSEADRLAALEALDTIHRTIGVPA